MAIDPVCKMQVDEKKAAAVSEYKGQKYYFCAVGCKKAFDKDPEKFLKKKLTANKKIPRLIGGFFSACLNSPAGLVEAGEKAAGR